MMFERYTENVRLVTEAAQNEARCLKHGYLGNEHLLLGLTLGWGGKARAILSACDITHQNIRDEIVELVPIGQADSPEIIPYTPRAKDALKLARREALASGHNRADTDHLLIALARQQDSIAARILRTRGMTLNAICHNVRTQNRKNDWTQVGDALIQLGEALRHLQP